MEKTVLKKGLNMQDKIASEIKNRRKTNKTNQVQQAKKTPAKTDRGSFTFM